MPIRQAVLARAVLAGAPTDILIGTVASTDTWLVKEVRVSNASGAIAAPSVYALNAGATIAAQIIMQSVPINGIVTVLCNLVLGPGDTLRFAGDKNNLQVWVSGALLPGHV